MTHPLTELEHAYVAAARRDDQAEATRLEQLLEAEHAAHEARLSAPGALQDAALWYASELGWPVFPCTPGGKRPATAHGFKDASTDAAQIEAWWGENPHFNIATPTGHHFDVIDIDGPAGLLEFGRFLDANTFTIQALSLTPRGRHYLIPPTGQKNFSTPGGVDYRGTGGYVILPPSRTPDGTYRWSTPPTPEGSAA